MWIALVLGLSVATAYESDPLTDRHLPLADARDALNDGLNELLADAVARTNERTRCEADPDRTRDVLARTIRQVTARPTRIPERGVFRSPGFTPYSAWIERSDAVEKFTWELRDDLYGAVRWTDSVVLSVAGPAPTVAFEDLRVGTDKFDHFLAFGYLAWKRSREGDKPERVARFDHRTERTFYGLLTSRAYSFGDIAANDDGFAFFAGLLDDESLLQLDETGCVVQVAPFDWGDWVDWRYDEALNPPIYGRSVRDEITARIAADPERYCAAWQVLGAEAFQVHLDEVLATPQLKERGVLAERPDPFGLEALCAGEGPTR